MKYKMKVSSQVGNSNQNSSTCSMFDRRSFLKSMGIVVPALTLMGCSSTRKVTKAMEILPDNVPGFEHEAATAATYEGWVPVSDRKVKFGIIGQGASRFGSAFGF